MLSQQEIYWLLEGLSIKQPKANAICLSIEETITANGVNFLSISIEVTDGFTESGYLSTFRNFKPIYALVKNNPS